MDHSNLSITLRSTVPFFRDRDRLQSHLQECLGMTLLVPILTFVRGSLPS
jgi:hypothetical protein